MQLNADIATQKFVVSASDSTPISSLSICEGNEVPVVLQIVDTSIKQVVNYDSWTIQVGVGAYQSPLIPVVTQVTNTSGTPTVWQFPIDTRFRAVKAAMVGQTALVQWLELTITDGRYAVTLALLPIVINKKPLDYAVSSSTSSLSSVSLSSASTPSSASSQSTSSSTIARSSSSSSSKSSMSPSSRSSQSNSSSSIHGHTLTAAGFGETRINGSLAFTGVFNARDYWSITQGGGTFYLFWNGLAASYVIDTSVGNNPTALYLHSGSPSSAATGNYSVSSGSSPGGTIS